MPRIWYLPASAFGAPPQRSRPRSLVGRTSSACTTSLKWSRSPASPTPSSMPREVPPFVRYNPRAVDSRISITRAGRFFSHQRVIPMPSPRFLSLLLCLLASLPAVAQIPRAQPDPLARMQAAAASDGCSAATSASLCEEAMPKIVANALGPSPLEENLRRLTDEVGGRMTGSPAMSRAVAWAVAAFRQAGVDEVRAEKYTIPLSWSEGATRLEVLMPAPFPMRLVSVGWAPPTPAAGLEANLVDIGEGSEADLARACAAAKCAILLSHSEIGKTWEDLFNEYLRAPVIINRAVKSGAGAILWMSTRERGLLYRHQNTLTGELDRLPQAIVAREDAQRLARFLAAGEKVRVRLVMPNRVGGPAEQENVIAEIRGREKPDEFVILGAHLDSWELGTGALDNGCNAALVIDALRTIKAAGLKPRRTIRFILFSGEEEGMMGSRAYAVAHRNELDKMVGVAVIDGGVGRVTGFDLGGRKDMTDKVAAIVAPLKQFDATELKTDDVEWGTDHYDFLLEGVPTLVAEQEEGNYLPNYHATSDTNDT